MAAFMIRLAILEVGSFLPQRESENDTGFFGFFRLLKPHPPLQRITDRSQPYAEEVERQTGNEDCHPGYHYNPPSSGDVFPARGQHQTPGGLRRLDPETQEAESRLSQNIPGHFQSCNREQRSNQVG